MLQDREFLAELQQRIGHVKCKIVSGAYGGIRDGIHDIDRQQVREQVRVANRATLIVLQLGAIGVVLAVSPYKNFELDRFFIPKELVLHLTALFAALLCVWRMRTFALDRIDTLLAGYVLLSIVSAAAASSWSFSTRALAVTLSGAAIFWTARIVANAGLQRPLLIAIVLAVVLGAFSGLLQAYGLETEYASLSRAPGGTFGNRNFLAHLCAIGAPVLLWCTVTSKRGYEVFLSTLSAAMLAVVLVLSRSRAAWLAITICTAILFLPTWHAMQRLSDTNVKSRLTLIFLAMAVGVLAALVLPNHLNWRSDSPYLDSVRGVVDYSSGSGRGRLIQYKSTLRMAEAHPVLGVGPGNWPLHYRQFAARHDPSLNPNDGMPANPWPSSDWMALLAERGVPATLLFVLIFAGLFVTAWRKPEGEVGKPIAQQFTPLALAAVLLITTVVSAFDAVLLLAGPTLIVWAAFGALSVPGKARIMLAPSDKSRRSWIIAGALVGTLMAARSALQLTAMATSCSWPSSITLNRCLTAVRPAPVWKFLR
jgi:O-antigen ligase